MLESLQVTDEHDASHTVSANVYVPARSTHHTTTIVLLPFWGGNAEIYRQAQEELARRCPEHASLAINYRGTGPAPNKEQDTDASQHSVRRTAASLRRFLQSKAVADRVGVSSVILCGHSWSAKVSMTFLALEAARAGIHVRGLVFLGPAPTTPIVVEAEEHARRRAAYDTLESAEWSIRNVLAHRPLPDTQIKRLTHHMVAMSPAARRSWIDVGIAEDVSRDVADFVAASPSALRVPIHVVAADKDLVESPGEVREKTVKPLRELGFSVDVEELKDCGHLIPMEAPDAVVAAIGKQLTKGS